MNRTVNPEMILLAREARGLTQVQLAQEIGVSQAAVSQAEKLHGKVSDSMLDDLSKVLNFPKDFFFQPEYRYPPATPLARKKQSLPQKIKNQLEAEANVRRLQIKRLLDSVEIPDYSLPDFDIDQHGGPEGVANHVRRALKLPRGPLNNLTEAIEKLGIIIIPCTFNTNKLDGFTIISEDVPIILVNQDMPWCRLRFTLAHELGHIVLKHVEGPKIEEEANDFASALLMPSDDIGKDLWGVKIDLQLLAMLKPYWKVSMQALLMRAGSLGCLTKNQSTYLWMTLNKMGFRNREPIHLDIQPENPTLLQSIVELHLNDLEYSKDEFLQIIASNEATFYSLYPSIQEKKKKISLIRRIK